MPDIIITPSTGKLEFVNNSAQNIRKHVFSMDDDGLSLDAPLAATSIRAPLNIINVNVDNSNTNYPFVLASGSAVTGIKTLMMDGAGGTYNPFTNIATIDISGNSATTTLASNSTNLGGVVAASYVTLTGTQTLTNKTITGTFTGNLTGTGSWATNAVSAVSATNSTQLNGQADSYYTNIPARLGYTPVNQTGGTITGNLTVNGNFAVNGSFTAFSASNVYISSSQLYIEDNILTLNAFSPYLRYAGVEMYDSGSGTLSSLLWDGEADYFFLTGSSVNGKIITGPDGQTNLTANFVPKATAGYKLGNSLIYDDGTNVGVGTTVPSTKFHVFGNAEVGDSTADTGLIVRHGAGAAQYGRIRFYSTSTNIHTIHSFPTAWNGGTFLNSSAGAINLGGTNGITFGSWNNIDVAFAQGGNNYFKSNVGIGTTSPAYLLDVSGSSRFGYRTIDDHYFTGSVNLSSTLTVSGLTYNESIQVDQFDYFQLQPYVEAGSFPSNVLQRLGGTIPAFTTYTGSTAPFGKVLYNTGYYEAIGDYIPVQAGETLYGEIWALRETGATGTAGGFFCGIARYDKNKNQIDGNNGLIYFITNNAVTVPSNSTWTKYSGSTTLPLTHTPYGASVTSDGGPIRYIRPYVIVNYSSGTIPTFWSGFKIRKVQLTRDSGNVVVNGNLGIGTTSPVNKLEVKGVDDATITAIFQSTAGGNAAYNGGIQLGNAASSQNSQIYHNSSGDNTLTFVSSYSSGTGNKFIFSPGGTERVRFQQNGKVGIGTTVPTSSLHIKPLALGADLLILERYATQAKLIYAYESAADGYLEVRSGADVIISKLSGYASTPSYFQSNVGIGLTLPTAPLHVVGVISGSSFSGAGTGLTGTAANLTVGTALNVGNGTITIAAGTGVGVGSSNTFTTNQSGATTVTITNNGVTAITTNTGLSTNASATGAVTITNTGVTAITTNTGLSTNASATGAVTITNTGVTSITTNTGLSTNASATGAVTITNSSPNATHTGDVTGATTLTIANDAVTTAKILNANVTLAKIANITAGTILGNNNASAAAAPLALTAAQVATMLSGQTMSIAGNAATATTATTANALNTSNSYTGVNFTATGFLQSNSGNIKSDTSFGLLTTTNGAQSVSVKGILLGTSYDTAPGANEIRTTNNTSLYLNARGTGDIQFQTADSLKMMLLSNGSVGIGTSGPGKKLDVEGVVRTRGATGTGGFEIGAATTGAAKWRIEWDSASDSLDFNWVG